MTRIFVTGGTGFVGRAILRHIKAQFAHGHDVPHLVIFTRSAVRFLGQFPEFGNLPWLSFYQGDICERLTLPGEGQFDCIVHAAAESAVENSHNPLRCFDQIVNGTRNLLDLAVELHVPRFLFISSGAVYGRQPDDLSAIPEDYTGAPDPLDPENVYGMSKRAAENLCAIYQQNHGIKTIIARCFAFAGPDLPLSAQYAIGNFVRDALFRDEILVSGDGSPLRTYLDQRDLAEWLMALLFKGQAGRAYNVGSDEVVSILDLAYRVREMISPDKPVRVLGSKPSSQNRARYIPDISSIKNELNLKIRYDLNDAIKSMALIGSSLQK